MVGACGLAGEESLDLDSGTTSDLEAGTGMAPPVPTSATPISTATAIRAAPANAAAWPGDTVVRDGADIDVDHVEAIPNVALDDDDIAFLHSAPPGSAQHGKR
ncbi:hypothetical protein LP420_05885 [Massilia sp. B-10]|nr:hypothetical protein LP420_05885 [Massilia sp. B-10]